MERKEEEEEKEGWKLGEVVSGGREGVEVSAKCGGEAKKCHTARDEIALLGVCRRHWRELAPLPCAARPSLRQPAPSLSLTRLQFVQTAKSICLTFLFFLPLRSSSNQSR